MVQNNTKITENDCQETLAKYFKTTSHPKLINYSYAPISEDINGYLGEHLLLKINVEDDPKRELRFFAKAMSDQDSTAEFAKSANVFAREIQCYKFLSDIKNVYPNFDASFAPKFYYSRADELIIMEDLTDHNYQMSQTIDLDLEHIKLTLKATARFHAGSLIFEEVKSKQLGRRYQLTEDYGKYLEEALYCNNESLLSFQYIRSGLRGLCALTDVFKTASISPSEFKTKIWSLSEKVYEEIKPSQKFRNVWCNGDPWTKNVMFKYNKGVPIDCKIFDFQLQRYNPPAHDVVFFIYQTTDAKTRQKYFDYLLDYYYECLRDELKSAGLNIEEILGKEEFDSSVTSVFPAVKLTKAIYKTLSSASQENMKELAADSKKYADVTFGDRSEFALKEFKNVQSYRDVLIGLLGDLEDLVTHDGSITKERCHKILREKLDTMDYELLEYVENDGKLETKVRLNGQKEIFKFEFVV